MLPEIIRLVNSFGTKRPKIGTKRILVPVLGLFRIHDPSYGHNDIGVRKPHEIQYELDQLNGVRESLARIIARKTGKKQV